MEYVYGRDIIHREYLKISLTVIVVFCLVAVDDTTNIVVCCVVEESQPRSLHHIQQRALLAGRSGTKIPPFFIASRKPSLGAYFLVHFSEGQCE